MCCMESGRSERIAGELLSEQTEVVRQEAGLGRDRPSPVPIMFTKFAPVCAKCLQHMVRGLSPLVYGCVFWFEDMNLTTRQGHAYAFDLD